MPKQFLTADWWFSVKSDLEVLRSRYALYGPKWFFSRITKRFIYLLAWCALLPITFICHLLGYRRVMIYPDRIGHLAVEIDGFLKEQALGTPAHARYFILSIPGRVANPSLLHDYWSKKITVVRHPALTRLLDIMTSRWLMRHNVNRMVLTNGGTSKLYKLYTEWNGKPPLIKLDEHHRKRGREALLRLGAPQGSWFACVHTREPGYSPADEIHMDFRNGDPINLIPAIQEIIARGGFCVRMGDSRSQPLPSIKGLIDYPRSAEKSDWMDVFLCAECRFFLGANSGLHFVSNIFGRPVALANLAPIGALAPCPGDLSIPKLIRNKTDLKILSFNEALLSPSANYQHSTAFKKDGLELIENDEDDIRDLVTEMLDRLEGRWKDEVGDTERQQAYADLFKQGHFSYGASSRIGAFFLRKHCSLLEIDSLIEPDLRKPKAKQVQNY